MIRNYLPILSLFILTLFSCSQDEEYNDFVSSEDKVVLLTQIGSAASDSRAVIGIDGKGHFVDGDAISLYVNGAQQTQTMSGGKWTPELLWKNLNGESATFRAFYPQLKHNDVSFTHTVATNQNEGKNFEESDLLFASEVTGRKGEKVKLNFKHLMSCLTVVLKSDDYTEAQLSQAVVKVNAYNKVDLKNDGTVGKVHDYILDKSDMAEITFKYQGNGTFQAVMCPQGNLHSWWYPNDCWLSITIYGKTHILKEPPATLANGVPFNDYVSGQNVTLNYQIKNSNIANQRLWVDGVQGIPESSSSEWKLIDKTTSKLKYLPWKSEYGWFDCSKKNTADSEPYHDMNKCWAATASNLIHWWLARNEANIQKYCLKKKVASLSELKVPHIYTNHNETEVFQAFRDKFTDEGSFARLGMEWYFLGKYKNEPGRSQLINPNVASGGFFKEVLGENTKMSELHAISSMKELNTAIKKGLLEKKGIAFSILMTGFNSGHAMTIWGAKFDKKGDVCAIYYVDNNDGTLGQEHIGLIEARVGEYEGTDPEKKGRACLENWDGKLNIQIQTIDLLDLQEEAWKQYLSH